MFRVTAQLVSAFLKSMNTGVLAPTLKTIYGILTKNENNRLER